MRLLLPLFALAALTGCVLPPALTIAATALSGASYLATGKGPADHARSAATAGDCDFLRALAAVPRTPLCIAGQPAQVAAIEPASMEPPPFAAITPAAGFADNVATAAAPAMNTEPVDTATMALPADAAAAIAEAIARRDARAANAALMASLLPTLAPSNPTDNAADAHLSSAVIAAIAAHPEAVTAIAAATTRAAPEHQATITARASAAFPGFAPAIARAAAAQV